MKKSSLYCGGLALTILLSFAGCGKQKQTFYLPLELYRRSVLDQNVRMLTLQYAGNNFLAYDLQHMQPYKFWTGGVLWQGAAFNNVKTIQPSSFGSVYWEQQDSLFWQVTSNGKTIPGQVKFESYEITADSQISITYTLKTEELTYTIHEKPRLYTQGDSMVWERHFDFPQNSAVHIDAGRKKISAQIPLKLVYARLPVPLPPMEITSEDGAQYWLDRSGCNTCHEVFEKGVGPAYVDIAHKYNSTPAYLDTLIRNVRNGSTGRWGAAQMTPHPDLATVDIKNMLRYILSLGELKKESPPSTTALLLSSAVHRPGFGAPLVGVHPAYDLIQIRPENFTPRVGGLALTTEGDLLVSTWDSLGAVYKLSGLAANDSKKVHVKLIASGLAEPLGLVTKGPDIFVLQKQELTQLIDKNGDGLTDLYRCINSDFEVTADFHEFSYGLLYHQGKFFGGLGLAMRLMSTEQQKNDRGTVFSIDAENYFRILARGLRQPNGVGIGPEGELFVTENQGQWVPACKFIHVEQDSFYGCQFGTGDRFINRTETLPAVYMPQDEIANSPSQPLLLTSGPFQGHLLFGDVTYGGIQRVFLEKIQGAYQGAVFRFSQGLEAGINRLVMDDQGAIYAGGVGMNGGWAHRERQFGLQKLIPNGATAFDLLSIQVTPGGFSIQLTSPLHESIKVDTSHLKLTSWYYQATPAYGGPKRDFHPLTPKNITLSEDRKKITLQVPGLKRGYVVHFMLSDEWKDHAGRPLWNGEAWYTLKNILPSEHKAQ